MVNRSTPRPVEPGGRKHGTDEGGGMSAQRANGEPILGNASPSPAPLHHVQALTVVIVGSVRLYREGLAEMISCQPQFEVVATPASGAAALACVCELVPDISLIDMAMLDSVGAVRAIAEAVPRVKIVALAVPETESHILACAEAGVAGYVPRDGSLSDLMATLASVGRGETICSARIAASLLRRVALLANHDQPRSSLGRLTPREAQIMELMEEGLSNKQIARRLRIGLPTVKNHVHNILLKLSAQCRTEAVKMWRDRGGRSSPRFVN
jgi:two-component system, NarL family, nitrate/nitrite response regulator NarL